MIRSLLIFPLLSLFSCKGGGDNFPDSDRNKVIKDVRETLMQYQQDVKEQGAMGQLKYLDSTADFSWSPPGSWYDLSYDSVSKIMRTTAASIRTINNNWDTLRIIPLDENYAGYTGRIHSIVVDITGKTTASSLRETGIMVKRKGGWKLLSGQTTILQQ